MSNVEHYFENLLFHGCDCVKGEPNKNSLTPEVQDAVETCAAYVRWTMFGSDVECRDFLRATINRDVVSWARKYYEEDPDAPLPVKIPEGFEWNGVHYE